MVTAITSEEGGETVNRPLARNRGAAVAARIGRRGGRPAVEIVAGVSNRLHKLVLAVGSQPRVVQCSGVRWSRKKNELQVGKSFFDADVSQQARLIESALI